MSIGKDAHYYVAGAGLWYGFSFLFAFYPAWVFMLTTIDYLYGWSGLDKYDKEQAYAMAGFWGIIIFLVYTGILGMLIMNIRRTWGVVVFLYIITLYPFIKWFVWCGTSDPGPFPGVNWIPWW